MNRWKRVVVAIPALACLLTASGKSAQASGAKKVGDDHETKAQVLSLRLDSMDGLEIQGMTDAGADPVKIQTDATNYRGRRAVKIVNDDGPAGTASGGQALAIVKTSDFKDCTIEAEVAGFPRQGAKPGTRGFIGVAFRVQDHGSRYEAFYLRMTNGRADDQLQRNHSAQYVSHPDFPWNRLREENPGVYESYVDLDAGAWTRIKIVVAGTKARLYVNGADQPCLIVNDLKLGESHGQIALWTGSDTEAYFSNLKVTS
jgi:3-keto-disaccharide hydrolase